jgi:protein-tyrosine-phosphatase
MAEGILKSVLSEKGVKNISVSSAGTAGLDKLPASAFAVEAAKLWNVDISSHRSTPLTKEIINSANLILAMSSNHIRVIQNLAPNALKKTYLLKGFPKAYSPMHEDVYDPIGGPLDLYNQTFLELDEKIRGIVGEIIELSDNSSEGNV